MADDKKGGGGGKKDKGGGATKLSPLELVIFWFIVLSLLGGILGRITTFLSSGVSANVQSSFFSFFSQSVAPFLKILSYGVSVLSFFGIVWCLGALTKINLAENEIYNPIISSGNPLTAKEEKNKRWERVVKHINSANPSDWKFAILEADIILDELLTAMNYKGETLSDKLKRVEKSDFQTVDLAWEAHKIRNSIAHEGADFMINEREARRVVGLFEEVFKEFHFI